jgi:hypothetical protein
MDVTGFKLRIKIETVANREELIFRNFNLSLIFSIVSQVLENFD